MKVWIQAHKGERPASKNFFEAMCGFEELGAEIRFSLKSMMDMHWEVTGCFILTMQNFWQRGGQN